MIRAAARGEVKRCTKWLRQGHVDAQCEVLTGNGMLHSASVHEQLELMRTLLKHGATVDLLNFEGSTALMAAAEQARYGSAAVRILLDHKADPNLATNVRQVTALMSAARNGHEDVVTLLLENGADPDLRSDDFGTALHQAAAAGHTGCARALLRAGAKTDSRNLSGCTPRDLAVKHQHVDVARLLGQDLCDGLKSCDDLWRRTWCEPKWPMHSRRYEPSQSVLVLQDLTQPG